MRSKLLSLSLINWNGFFARTFALDERITVLSGGNGAGKSTVLAAFICALMPDLSLLNFKNTTEAGSTSGQRDRGLFGKLRPGVCYVILRFRGGHRQLIWIGVRLQQIPGREQKIALRTFVVENAPENIDPVEYVTAQLEDDRTSVEVLDLAEWKARLPEAVKMTTFQTVAEYHHYLFEQGLLPKALRTSQDRHKFYRLLEASLYGGMASSITRALKNYLLPEQIGIRKGFQELESALSESRLTVSAIQQTQKSRDLFKSLLSAATQYVRADYMRQCNQAALQRSAAVAMRQRSVLAKASFQEAQTQKDQLIALSALQEQKRLQALQVHEATQALHLQYLQCKDLEKGVEEQALVVHGLELTSAEAKRCFEAAQSETLTRSRAVEAALQHLNQLQAQVADQVEALNQQQIQAVQYQQAIENLASIQKEDPTFTTEQVHSKQELIAKEITALRQVLIQNVAKLEEEKLRAARREKGIQALLQLDPSLSHASLQAQQAQAKIWVDKITTMQQRASAIQTKRSEADWAKQRATLAKRLQDQWDKLRALDDSIMPRQLQAKYAALSQATSQAQHAVSEARRQWEARKLAHKQAEEAIKQHEARLPKWHEALEAKSALEERAQCPVESMQDLLGLLAKAQAHVEAIAEALIPCQTEFKHRQRQIQHLQAELNASLLPEDDSLAQEVEAKTLEQHFDQLGAQAAKVWGAVCAPWDRAFVVENFAQVENLNLEALKETVYFIDPERLKDWTKSPFKKIQPDETGVWVEEQTGLLRRSPYCARARFGRANRTALLEAYLSEQAAQETVLHGLQRDLERGRRYVSYLTQLLSSSLYLAFEESPKVAIQRLQGELAALKAQMIEQSDRVDKAQRDYDKGLQLQLAVQALLPHEAALEEDFEGIIKAEVTANIAYQEALSAEAWLRAHADHIQKLSGLLESSHGPVEDITALADRVAETRARLNQLSAQQLLVETFIERLPHLAYKGATSQFQSLGALSSALQIQCAEMQAQYDAQEKAMKAAQAVSLVEEKAYLLKESQLAAQSEVLQQCKARYKAALERYTAALPAETDLDIDARLQAAQAEANRLHTEAIDMAKRLTEAENTLKKALQTQIQARLAYSAQRQAFLRSQRSLLQQTRGLKKQGLYEQIYRASMQHLEEEVLRSLSDQSLGALRPVVAEIDSLREALAISEDPKRSQEKTSFYLAVVAYLQSQIRQDFFQTNDPLQAIEEMEVELERLAKELVKRESELAVSASSVAQLIEKAVTREQYRIFALNQQLALVRFGQISAIRLQLRVKPGHARLLEALSQAIDAAEWNDKTHSHFAEALATLYKRLLPDSSLGESLGSQALGEALLDYRNYLALSIEVQKGEAVWQRAESGALSTGEAIGTGMALFMLVLQSWEEESARWRNRAGLPARILLLDEAARLDNASIDTLAELSQRLDMQLLLAAPDHLHTNEGTTYRLKRWRVDGVEEVMVVGLLAKN